MSVENLEVKIQQIQYDIVAEYARARMLHETMPSPHHGLSVLQEELHELQQLVYAGHGAGRSEAAYIECIQIAASAMRYAAELAWRKGAY